MRNRIARAIAGLAAALLMALAVGTASANSLSVSSQLFRIVWTRLTFSESGGGFPITCPVTLEGSFHSRTITKAAGTLVAHITSAVVNDPGCTAGHATILDETLPWRVAFQAFSGRLPNIILVRHTLIGAGFQLEPGLEVICLAQTTAETPAAGNANREAGGNITTLETDSELAIPATGSPVCPLAGIFSGTGEVYVTGTRDRVRMTLV